MNAIAHSPALRQIKDLPGPRGVPVLGNVFQVNRAQIHQDMERWANQYGPLFKVKLARATMLVVADHALFGAIMKDRPNGFRRTPMLGIIGHELGLPQGLFNAEGDDWLRQRRMVMASFAPGHVRAYFPSLVKVTLRLQERWNEAARAAQPINLQADLMRFTVDAIAGLAFGKDINTLQAGEDVIQRHLDKLLPAIFNRIFSIVPIWRYIKRASDRELEASVAVIKNTIEDFVSQARQRLRDDPSLREQPRNLLEAMIVAADQPESGLGDRQVVGNVLTMLLAGEDTTANTLAWMIHLLKQNPQALQRVQLEVRTLAPNPAQFTVEMMDSLVYLDACASETMRLKPVAPFLPLQAMRDTQVGDVAVRRGTIIWGVMRHDSVREPYFANPDAFEPARWLADAPHPLSAEAKRAAMPFGSGPRMCPGRYLALLEMKMAMAMLLSSFDITAVDTPDGKPAQELMAFTMNPVGLTMRLSERRAT
jgi:cytochrome P450